MTQWWKASERLTVEYMPWSKFVKGVDDVEENVVPDIFASYDLIWGGADLNLDIK